MLFRLSKPCVGVSVVLLDATNLFASTSIYRSIRTFYPTLSELQMAFFWDVLPYSISEIVSRFRVPYCRHHQRDDRSIKHLRNVGNFLPD
jgi:hypothetical protein